MHLLQQFNQTISQWIDSLDSYTLEMLCTKPAAAAWSLGQVYVHIAADTAYFINEMAACLQSTANSNEVMHPHASTMLRNNAFPDTLIQGPATVSSVPQPASKEALLQQLHAVQQQVNDLCARYPVEASTGKSRHPGLGYFNAAEWLHFAEIHMRHHFRQKQRIDAQLFPYTKPAF
ncbi:DinB family protein [Deminuibacter soli]|nr:DinB family protein [Deminuibacter soli]